MSTIITLTNQAAREIDSERAHRMRLYAAATIAILLVIALAIYGAGYYTLSAVDRPFSPKHELLKPSGRIGIKLGLLGVGLFAAIFMYPLRKRVSWLAKLGTVKHWLDFHIIFGLTAPVIIAFHSSFKFKGIAGVAFWIMVAVAVSGVVGRYIYSQIPRSLSSAELSLKELDSLELELTGELAAQNMLRPSELQPILRMPTTDEVRRMPMYRALLLMMVLDLARPFHVARLRARVVGWGGLMVSLGGLLRTSHAELEHVIRTARRKSALSMRIVFLARTQQVFHLWHVIHRPFSYSFAVLALIHIAVVMSLGFI